MCVPWLVQKRPAACFRLAVISLATSLVKIESIWNQELLLPQLSEVFFAHDICWRKDSFFETEAHALRLLVVLASSSSVLFLVVVDRPSPLSCSRTGYRPIRLLPRWVSGIFKSMVGKSLLEIGILVVGWDCCRRLVFRCCRLCLVDISTISECKRGFVSWWTSSAGTCSNSHNLILGCKKTSRARLTFLFSSSK
jgi:hypothetical protein